jgi:hypothetical protein
MILKTIFGPALVLSTWSESSVGVFLSAVGTATSAWAGMQGMSTNKNKTKQKERKDYKSVPL